MLADLVPVALDAGFTTRKPLTSAERFKRWRDNNRAKWNGYRRDWYARRKS